MNRNYSFSDGITIFEFEDEALEMCYILNREDDEGLLYLVSRWGGGWAIFIEDQDGVSMGAV